MSYREIAEALKLPSVKAALNRSRRGKWPRQLNNSGGVAMVAVPLSVLEAAADGTPRMIPHEKPPAKKGEYPTGSLPNEEERDGSGDLATVLEELRSSHERLTSELRRRAETAEAVAQEVPELRQHLGQAQGEAAGLREALRIAEEAQRQATDRAAALQAERDTAQHRAAEAVTLLSRIADRLDEFRQQAATAAQHAADAEQRAAMAEVGRQEAETRLAQLTEQMKAISEESADPAELEAARSRAEAAEERAAVAKRLANEADRRATAATERLDRFQRERIAQAQAAAENTRVASQETVPLWRRLFGRQGR